MKLDPTFNHNLVSTLMCKDNENSCGLETEYKVPIHALTRFRMDSLNTISLSFLKDGHEKSSILIPILQSMHMRYYFQSISSLFHKSWSWVDKRALSPELCDSNGQAYNSFNYRWSCYNWFKSPLIICLC